MPPYNPYISGYPTNLSAISDGSSITLTWTAPDSSYGVLSGYRVYRAYTKDEVMQPIGLTLTESYTDNTIQQDREYYYRVTTVYGNN